jgi:HAD superfamily hydrolase (TIGR01509 family)
MRWRNALIRAVIFDMDGVLVDSYAAHLESWRILAREIGAEISDEEFDHTFGRTSRDIIRLLFDITDAERVRAYDQRKEALYREIVRDDVPEMPGATALLAHLAGRGIALGVGTSGPRENIDLVCDALGWNGLLSVRVTGADVTNGKPDPEIFVTGASRLGVLPAECVVIEDAPAGIEAAKRGGMHCIGLTSTHGSSALSEADAIVGTLSECGGVIEAWAGGSAG